MSGSAPAQQPSPAAVTLAKEIITLKGEDMMLKPLVSGVIEKAKGMFLQTNPMLGKDLNEVAARLHAELAPRTDQALSETAKLYASRFTEQELKDVLAFYKSALGRKVVAEEPAIAVKNVSFLANWADKLSEEVIGKMRAEMRKRGHEI
jgi:hypothetical protein